MRIMKKFLIMGCFRVLRDFLRNLFYHGKRKDFLTMVRLFCKKSAEILNSGVSKFPFFSYCGKNGKGILQKLC